MNVAFVSSWDQSLSNHIGLCEFLKSARKHEITLANSDPTSWIVGGAREFYRKIIAQVSFVNLHPEFTHFVFIDSYDVIFCGGIKEILYKYLAYKSPIVFGTEVYPWPDKLQASQYPDTPNRCKYLNAGFWMGESGAVKSVLSEAGRRAESRTKCDQGIFVDLFLSGAFPIVLDTSCSLLFCCNMDSLDYISLQGCRPICTDTKELPCVFHGNGASPVCRVIKMIEDCENAKS